MEKKECPECRGTGWVISQKKGKEVAARCKCFSSQRVRFLSEQANIPKRYKDCTFANFDIHNDSHRHALKLAKRFVSNWPVQDIGLLFQGPCGVGKTHLAVAVIQELIREKNVSGYFCDFRELIRSIQNSYSSETGNATDLLAPVFRSDVLVLDELGAKRTSAWVEETVFYIINHRYNNEKLTLFTSNYIDSQEEEEDTRDSFYKKSDDSLVDRIGVRLRSRIYEMCKIVNIEGDDIRKKVKQAGYRF